MTAPTGGEPTPGAIPSFDPGQDPFDVNRMHLEMAMRRGAEQQAAQRGEAADYAGTILTAREAQIGRWFWDARGAELQTRLEAAEARATAAEAALATAAVAATPVTAPAAPAEGAGGAAAAAPAERQPRRETLDNIICMFPAWASYREGRQQPVQWTNGPSQPLVHAMSLPQAGEQRTQLPYVDAPAEIFVNESDASASLRRHRREVLTFTAAPESYNDFVVYPGNGNRVREPLVVVHYRAAADVPELGEHQAELIAVVPMTLAKRLDAATNETDPRAARKVLTRFLSLELGEDQDEAETTPATPAETGVQEPIPEGEVDPAADALVRFEMIGETLDQQRAEPVLAKVSNVPGIAGHGEGRNRPERDGYTRKHVNMRRPAPAAPAAPQGGDRRPEGRR